MAAVKRFVLRGVRGADRGKALGTASVFAGKATVDIGRYDAGELRVFLVNARGGITEADGTAIGEASAASVSAVIVAREGRLLASGASRLDARSLDAALVKVNSLLDDAPRGKAKADAAQFERPARAEQPMQAKQPPQTAQKTQTVQAAQAASSPQTAPPPQAVPTAKPRQAPQRQAQSMPTKPAQPAQPAQAKQTAQSTQFAHSDARSAAARSILEMAERLYGMRAGTPPVSTPPAGASPVSTAPVGTPPVSTPPAGASPAGASPVSASKAGTDTVAGAGGADAIAEKPFQKEAKRDIVEPAKGRASSRSTRYTRRIPNIAVKRRG